MDPHNGTHAFGLRIERPMSEKPPLTQQLALIGGPIFVED